MKAEEVPDGRAEGSETKGRLPSDVMTQLPAPCEDQMHVHILKVHKLKVYM